MLGLGPDTPSLSLVSRLLNPVVLCDESTNIIIIQKDKDFKKVELWCITQHRLYPVDKKRVNEYGESFDDTGLEKKQN